MSADLPPPCVSFGPVQSLIYLRAGDYFTADQMRAYATKAVAAQAAELEALRADAERYRWLRQQHWYEAALCVVVNPKNAVRLGHDCPSRERLDSAVDAARAALKEQTPNDQHKGPPKAVPLDAPVRL